MAFRRSVKMWPLDAPYRHGFQRLCKDMAFRRSVTEEVAFRRSVKTWLLVALQRRGFQTLCKEVAFRRSVKKWLLDAL